MKEACQVIFAKKKNGTYLVDVPDLDCVTEGKSMNDAINMARDLIGLKGIVMEDNGQKMHKASKTIDSIF